MFSRKFRRSAIARFVGILGASLIISPMATSIAYGVTHPAYQGNSIPSRPAVAIVDAPGGVKVNTFLGMMFFTRTDLHIPGRGLPLEIQLTYNSKDCGINTAFGYGWRMSYDMSIYRLSANQLVVNWGDGRKDQFVLSGGVYTPVNEGVHATLEQSGPNTLLVTMPRQMRFFFGLPVAVGSSSPLQQIVDPNGNAMTMSYNGSGQMTAITDASGRSLTLSYAAGHVSSVTDANSSPPRAYSYQYDAMGNLTQITDPLGSLDRYTYDTGHRMTTVTDPLGTTKFTYSGVLFLLSSVSRLTPGYVLLSKRSFAYGVSPNPTTTVTDMITSSQNAVTVYKYDANSHLTSVVDPLGHVSSRTYDAAGNVVSTTDALSHTTQYAYDASYNVVAVTDALGHTTQFAYDAQNRVTSTTDPLGHTTSLSYDGAGNLISYTDPLGHSTQYAYDAAGQMLSRTNANGAPSSYGYDAAGNRTSATDPLGHTTSYGYDGAGNVISRTDANGNTVNYGYDAMDRQIRRTLPNTTHADFTYDANGNMLSAKDPNSDLKYAYDANGRVTQARDNKMSRLITYQYDGLGNLIQRKGPEPGVGATYLYDARSRMTSMMRSSDQFTFAYDAADRMIKSTLPNGSYTDYGYDSADRQISVINRRSDAAIHSRFDCQYDADGNRTQVDTLGGESIAYQYDGRDQLTRETRTGGATNYDHQFAYDAVGNRIQTNEDGVITNSVYDGADRLIQRGITTSYQYDANGNQVQRNDSGVISSSFYDAIDRQTGFQAPGVSASYGYDALGRRISKTVGGITTRWIYDGNRQATEYSGGVYQAENLYGPGTDWHLARYSVSQALYYLQDGLGSVHEILDAGEGLKNRYDYDAWGNRVVQMESVQNDFTYRGREVDRESGLYHFRDRQYDSSIGRFSQLDSIEFNTGRSRYSHGDNQPGGGITAGFPSFFKKIIKKIIPIIKKAAGLDDDSKKSNPKSDKDKDKGSDSDSSKDKDSGKSKKKGDDDGIDIHVPKGVKAKIKIEVDTTDDKSGSNADKDGKDSAAQSGNHPK